MGHPTISSLLNRPQTRASASTVFRLMKRLDLLPAPWTRKRKKAEPPKPPNPATVGLTIGMDFTHWKALPICNVIEYESRFCLASIAYDRETAVAATDALKVAFNRAARLGLPRTKIEVKSDHGTTFTADQFNDFIERQGCWHTLSAVGRPQGMGRVERFNRSSKEQRLRLADVEDRSELQAELDGYRKFYNHNRPHRALNGMTPYEFLCAARH
jgi:transposase InsO family protein